ncbi:MAG: radical SAM protein [Spirochaetia bacterium]|jgi:MoaA/NifB/PqqE/SkfB family radical SAM enzyme|nr:radical SAM protein [Spirochaetia bacterium]
MEKIVRFIGCHVPMDNCNLQCSYCFVSHRPPGKAKRLSIGHSPEEVRTALSKERLGGTCVMHFAASGETTLSSELFPIIHELLKEGHYVSVVTNGTINEWFEKISSLPESFRKKIFFKFSFHFLELKRKGLIEKFCSNINKSRAMGCSVSVEIVSSDDLIPYIDEIKEICNENFGALCHLTIPRDDSLPNKPIMSSMTKEQFISTWETFNSEQFEFKAKIFNEKRNEFCYAGLLSLYVFLDTGDFRQCYRTPLAGNIYRNIDQPLKLEPVGNHCPDPHCDNGHAFLTLGLIPELEFETPTYAATRNRLCKDGSEWLTDEFKNVFGQRLYENSSLPNYKKDK